MSDSDSKDSDERIRYKTESVRNKSEETGASTTKSRDVRQRDKDSCRYRKRYSRSPSPKRSYLKNKKRKKKKRSLSRSSSTSSSDRRVETGFIRKESKRDYVTNSGKITSQAQNELKSLNERKHVAGNEIIGPVLPPHLLYKNNDNLKLGNIIKDTSSRHLSPCSSVGPMLPPYMTTFTKLESSMPVNTSTTNLEQNQPTVQGKKHIQLPTCIGPIPDLLNSDKHNEVEQASELTLQSQSFSSLASSDRIIGPSLPPHLQKKIENPFIKSNIQAEEVFQSLPSTTTLLQSKGNDAVKMVGPSLPSHLRNVEDAYSDCNLQTEVDFQSLASTSVGESQDCIMIGPSLPALLRKKLQEETKESSIIHVQTEEKEDVYGPLPIGISSDSLSHKALEERALQLKIDQLKPQHDNEPGRESWMIELPTAKAANFGLGPRQFRNRSGPDLSDRSSWTDLPGDKNKKKSEHVPVDLKAEAELKELIKRDKEQEMLTRKHKRKEKSLLKRHKEQLDKEKKEEKSSERRPFSRDIDLQVNRFDDAQKQAILKKAQLLDDRFSSGKSKFL